MCHATLTAGSLPRHTNGAANTPDTHHPEPHAHDSSALHSLKQPAPEGNYLHAVVGWAPDRCCGSNSCRRVDCFTAFVDRKCGQRSDLKRCSECTIDVRLNSKSKKTIKFWTRVVGECGAGCVVWVKVDGCAFPSPTWSTVYGDSRPPPRNSVPSHSATSLRR